MEVLNLTKITIAWEMFEQGIPKAHIANKLQVNRETVYLWILGIQNEGLLAFLDTFDDKPQCLALGTQSRAVRLVAQCRRAKYK